MKNKKISKKELIKKVFALENRLGRKPKKRDNHTLYAHSRKYFGSWNNLMKAAGYETKKRFKNSLWKHYKRKRNYLYTSYK